MILYSKAQKYDKLFLFTAQRVNDRIQIETSILICSMRVFFVTWALLIVLVIWKIYTDNESLLTWEVILELFEHTTSLLWFMGTVFAFSVIRRELPDWLKGMQYFRKSE